MSVAIYWEYAATLLESLYYPYLALESGCAYKLWTGKATHEIMTLYMLLFICLFRL